MNERIKELSDQAKVTVLTSKGHPDIIDGCYIISPPKLEKFAELIVRECLNKIENEAAQYAEPVWAFELVNDIKEHFGVEE